MKKFIYLFLMLFVITLSAQNSIRVEEFEINGSLKIDDPISAGLGRINAVKLNLTKGDKLYSNLTADFLPLLVLVPPSGEYKIMYPDEKSFAASFNGTIDETGEWLIYIVGDSTDTGNYTLVNKYASVNSMNFNSGTNFCEKIKLLLNHEKAHFYFLKEDEIDDSGIWESAINLNNSVSSEIFGDANEYFKSILLESQNKNAAVAKFDETNNNLLKCLGSQWEKVENNWHNVLGKGDTKEKILLFKESGSAKRYVKVIFSDESFPEGNELFRLSLIISDLK